MKPNSFKEWSRICKRLILHMKTMMMMVNTEPQVSMRSILMRL